MKINLVIENEREFDALIYAMSENEHEMDICRKEFRHNNHLNLGGIRISSDRGREMTINIDTDTLTWLSEKVGKLYFGLSEGVTQAVIEHAKKMDGWEDHFLAEPALTVDGCKIEGPGPREWPEDATTDGD